MHIRIVRLLMALCLIGSPWLTSRPIEPLGLIEQSDAANSRPMDLDHQIALHPPLRLLDAGTPQTITLEIVPATLIANSGATAMITATVYDLTGDLVSGVNLSGYVSPTERGSVDGLGTTVNGQVTGTWTAGNQIGLGTLEVGDGIISGTASITLTAGTVATVTVVPNTTTVTVGLTTTFTANGTDAYGNAVIITPTWTTNGGSIDAATGVFTAPITVTSGIVITATDGAISGTAIANIIAGTLHHITVSPSSADVVVGGTQTFSASGFDQYNNLVPITPTWTTNGGSINAVSGLFTAPITATTGRLVTATYSAIPGTAIVNIIARPLNSIVVAPNPANVVAGTTQTFTALGFDQYNNLVPITPTWTTNGGSINAVSGLFTARITATTGRLVTATYSAIPGTAIVNIIAGPLTKITVSPNAVTMTVATTRTFTASGFDQYNNAVAIAPTWTTKGGSIDAVTGFYTAQITATAGRLVTATQGIISGTARVNLVPDAPYTLTLQPPTAVISAGQRITYTAIATDTYGNLIGDVTGSTTFNIAPAAGGSFAGNAVTPTVKNTWIVTGTIGSATSTATLTVTAAAFNRLAIENAPAGSGSAVNNVTLTVYDTLPVYAAAYDVYNNLIGPRNVTWTGSGVVAGNLSPTTGISTTFTPVISGTGIITATSGSITDRTGLITVQAPALQISKSADPDPVTPGEQLHYTIVYTNSGNAAAPNVFITETYPLSTSKPLAFPPPSSGNNIWSIGSLGAGVTGTIDVYVTVAGQMPVGSVLTNSVRMGAANVVSAIYTATTQVNAQPDFKVNIVDTADPVRPGDTFVYQITYRNDGTAPVTGLRITETYPSQVAFVSATPLPSIGNNVWLTNTLGGAGAARTILVTVRVNRPVADGTIMDNQVTIDSNETAPFAATEQTFVTAPEVQLSMIAVPLTPTANSLLTYALLYSNTGSSYAANTIITDALPANTSSAQCEPIDSCVVNNRIVTWDLGQVAAQSSDLVTLTVTIDNNLPDGTRITNTARLASSELVSAMAVVTSTITSALDLMVTNSNGVTALAAGDVTTYVLGYANLGTAPAQNVVITDRIPDNTTFVGCTACIPIGSRVYSFTLGTVDAAQSNSVAVSVRVASTLPAGLRFITNTARIATTTDGDDGVNNIADDVDAIATQPTLGLSVIYDASAPYPGKIITYTLRYTNTSAMDTTGVTINATRSTFVSGTPPGWTPLGGVDLHSIGALAAGQSGSITYLITLPLTFTAAMNAFTMTFLLQDNGPGGWPVAQAQVVPVIGVPDLTIERVIVPAAIGTGQKFTATVVVRNTGMGRACNPSTCGGFYIDAYIDPATPPPSYPYTQPDGDFYAAVPPIAAGQAVTINVPNIKLLSSQEPLLYFKVDNYDCSPVNGYYPCLPRHSLGGLVPESNEYNNVAGPITLFRFAVYLPLVLRSKP